MTELQTDLDALQRTFDAAADVPMIAVSSQIQRIRAYCPNTQTGKPGPGTVFVQYKNGTWYATIDVPTDKIARLREAMLTPATQVSAYIKREFHVKEAENWGVAKLQ